MTDKQIIIDVSKCKECGLRNCDGKLIYWCHTYDDHCADFNDCYYKQLKRKEQECEELKIYIESNEQQVKEVETLVMDNDRLINELDQLKQTLTEIKEIAEIRKDDINDWLAKEILQKISEVENG